MKKYLQHIIILVLGLCSFNSQLNAQCEVYDFNDQIVPDPFWHSCTGVDYTLNLYSPNDWADYTVDWGDGTVENGTNWMALSFISHFYALTVETYTITITNNVDGCQMIGTFVMEEPTTAGVVPPVGTLTAACAPYPVNFENLSNNVSENTIFTYDFGDGSPALTFDHTNAGQVISHTYEPNTVDCNTAVTLTAENYCNTIQGGPAISSWEPIQVFDVDDASISASATSLCFPENTVTFNNTTIRNCWDEGHQTQRYEYWNFGDYWGEGQDSIIDWRAWTPLIPYTLEFPGNLGDVYEVMMIDSNMCGLDTAYISVTIVSPPVADITIDDNVSCEGDAVTFNQDYSGNPDSFSWNFGDGTGWITTGSNDVTYGFNNPGIYTVANAIGIQGSAACADTAYATINILEAPQVTILADNLSGCDGLTVNFAESSSGADTWEWDFGNGNTFSGSSPPPQDYNTPGVYVVTVTASNSGGCIETFQEIVNVYNSPTVDFIADNVCEGTQAQFTDLSTSDGGDPIIIWDWDFGDSTGPSIEQHPVHQYALSGNYNANLTVSTVNCTADLTIPLTVEAAPVPVFIPSPDNGCAPLDVSFANSSINSNSYTWDFGDQSGSFADNPEHTFYNFGTADTTYTVVLTAYSNFGCFQSDSMDVIVTPGAQASFTDNAQPPGCAPFTAEFTNTSYGAVNYLWDFGDGSANSSLENPTHLYNNNTGFIETYDIQLIAYSPNGCNDTVVSTITVFPEPDFTFDVTPNNGCTPLIVSMPLVPSGQTFNWTFGDGQTSAIPNPTHIYENNSNDPITYTVTLDAISAFGCAGSSTSDLVVYPSPTADFSLSEFSGCSPLLVDITDLSTGATSGYFDFGSSQTEPYAGSTSHTFENISGSVESFDVHLHLENDFGCSSDQVTSLEVTPSANAEILVPDDGCSPHNVTFLNNSTNATSFQWDFGNGLISTQNNGTTTFFNNSGTDTTFTVNLIAHSPLGCDDAASADIVIHSAPSASFTSDVNTGCSVVSVEFTNNSMGANTYDWSYGDGQFSSTAANNHFHDFENFTNQPIEYIVTLSVSNTAGCTDSYELPITVYPQISSEFEQEENGCSPLVLSFDNESYGSDTEFVWDFGDGTSSSLSNPVHTFTNNTLNDTTFTVELTTTSVFGCAEVYSQEIVVYATPSADVSVSQTQGCYPLEVTFQNQSIGSATYSWVYGTGEVGNSPDEFHTHTFYNLQTIPVSYLVTLNAFSDNGCQSTDEIFVEVQPQLIADFDAPTEGCSPLLIQFENESLGALGYMWDFGDGTAPSNQPHPSHIFENTTDQTVVYEVMLVSESYAGCTDTSYTSITVYPLPVAEFSTTPISQTFPETTVSLDNTSTGGSDVQYEWTFGDATSSVQDEEPVSHTYDTWGDYTIQLVADNGQCSDSFSQEIEIIPPPPVSGFIGPAKGCAPLTVEFTNTSSYGLSYHWEFGDGGQAFVSDPIYTFQTPGTYSVRLVTTGYNNGETNELIREDIIVVHEAAVAAFAVAPAEVSIPSQPVFMVNLSQSTDEYLWNFGDGNTSTEENPTHFYQEEGVYSITLTVNNENNCPDSLTLFDAVTATAEGNIVFPNAFTPVSGGTGGEYDPQSFNNDVFFPIQSGVEDYQLQIFNKWGELMFESKDVSIGWDGTYRGELAKQDVYVWKAKVKFSDGTELTRAGDVTLLR